MSYVLSPYKTVSEQARRCIHAEVCLWAATCSGPCWFAKRDFTLREPIDEFVDPSEMPALRKMVGEMHDALGSYTKVDAACCVQVGASNLKRIHTGKTRRTHRSIAEVIELAYEEVFECGESS